jgi:hypothetical protein
MTIGLGQEKDLLPFIQVASTGAIPLFPLTWEISNPAVLTIDQATGRVKGIGRGSVVVQIKAAGYEANPAQLVIEVVGEAALPVKDVKVLPESHHLVVGGSAALRAEVTLLDGQVNGNVVWVSSDDSIATVNQTSGQVSAVKPGRVTILAAYAPFPEFKGLAEVFVYATKADIPPSPPPVVTTAIKPTAQSMGPAISPLAPSYTGPTPAISAPRGTPSTSGSIPYPPPPVGPAPSVAPILVGPSRPEIVASPVTSSSKPSSLSPEPSPSPTVPEAPESRHVEPSPGGVATPMPTPSTAQTPTATPSKSPATVGTRSVALWDGSIATVVAPGPGQLLFSWDTAAPMRGAIVYGRLVGENTVDNLLMAAEDEARLEHSIFIDGLVNHSKYHIIFSRIDEKTGNPVPVGEVRVSIDVN